MKFHMQHYLVAPQISQKEFPFANLSTPSWSLSNLCSQYHISSGQHARITLATLHRQFFGEFAAYFAFIFQMIE